MKGIIIFSVLVISLLCGFFAVAGKKQCQTYRNKLDNIQAQQRQASSLKRSNSLSAREVKARDIWWRCESGKLKQKLKNKKQKAQKQKSSKKKKYSSGQHVITKQYQNNKPLVPFASNNSVVVRSKYQGEKLQAWLAFFKLKKMCARPKSMQQFAYCVEDKRRQQMAFEKNY